MLLFDLLEVIKDPERPFLINYQGKSKEYTYRDIALDNELLVTQVKALMIGKTDDMICYKILLRG